VIPASVRIFVCLEPVDMRRSFDGLALAAKDKLGQDPQSGALFVFKNRRSNRLKVLWFDKNGYCLLYKRLHRAFFRLPQSIGPGVQSVRIDGAELGRILAGEARERKVRRPAA